MISENKSIDKEYNNLKRRVVINSSWIMIPFISGVLFLYSGYKDKQEAISSYINNQSFICEDKNEITILIDKKDGWVYEEGYFKNKGSQIKAALCIAKDKK